MKILFLSRYSVLGGSSRYMVYDYVRFLKEAGIDPDISPLFDETYHLGLGELKTPTTARNIVRNMDYYLRRILIRLQALARAGNYDAVVLEKEVCPYLPFGLERLLTRKRKHTRLVTLFDDAVHAYYETHPSALVRLLTRRKIERIVQISDEVIVWNAHLGEWARSLNPNVTVLNTGVDLDRYRVKVPADRDPSGRLVIGWIGTPSSFEYIRELEGTFKVLAARYPVVLRVVSSQDYGSPNIQVENRRWSLEREVEDLCSFDAGIMPLPDNDWTRGKSGCKAVQYLAVGVPAICSPVGVATEIIRPGANGFLARTTDEWTEALARLLDDPDLRRTLGENGRAMVVEKYCLQAIAPRLIDAIKGVAGAPPGVPARSLTA
jgi:glycosyltransferase involved in cell wall biosynthesis